MNSNYPRSECPYCKQLIRNCNIKRRIDGHLNGYYDRSLKQISLDHEDLDCKYCGKSCSNKNSLIQHEIRCSCNPNRITIVHSNHSHEPRVSERKGLTYRVINPEKWSSSESLVCQYCGTNHTTWFQPFSSKYSLLHHERRCRYNPENILIHPEFISDLEKELDDDGKLFLKWRQKRYNAKTMGNECFLTFDDYCRLVKEAGLVSSQLGLNGLSYELARYNDEGPYEIGNCRFITHQENVCEMKQVVAARERRKLEEPIIQKKREELRLRREQNKEKERIRQSLIDPIRSKATSGEHNSSYGKHWITNGVESRKWHPLKDGAIPYGWRLGRVVPKLRKT